MIKAMKKVTATLLLTLVSSGAFALRISETFDVSVTLPSAAFHVIPADPGWIHLEQRLNWNPNTSELSRLRKQFDVKNENGAISARLSFEPYLNNGRDIDDIPLIVTFNDKRLTLDAQEVISEVDGRTGKRVALEIAAVKPGTGYRPGDYYGSVHMLFEAIVP